MARVQQTAAADKLLRLSTLDDNKQGTQRNFMGGKRKEWLRNNIGQFVKEYARKAQRGVEPNDRHYDRKIEKFIKQMDPRDLSDLLHDYDEEQIDKCP